MVLHNALRRMSLRWKINLMCMFIVLLFSIVVYFLILPYLEKEKTEERQGKLRAVVSSAVSLMDFYEKSLRKEAWKTDPSMPRTIDEAKRMVSHTLKEMRYDKTEYLFILDGNGTMLVHPMKPDLEGKNMLQVKDPEGILLFREMVMNSQQEGEAFVSYIWQSKYSPVIYEPQITYAKYYWPWDWVVCTSLYTQDISDAMRAITIKSALYDIAVAAAAMTFMFFFVHLSLSKPLRRLLEGVHEIRRGNLDHRIDISSLDEIGFLSQEFNHMVSSVRESRDRLITSESKYRDLTDLLPDIIYETDLDFRITYLNRSGHTLTGYSDMNVMQGMSFRNLIDDTAFDAIIDTIKEKKSQKFLLTHKVFRKDKSHFFGENYGSVIFEDMRPVGIRGSIRDVTEKIQMEEQLLQSQKMETIGTLAGGLAHDFNNVLAGITSTLSIVRYEIDNRPEISKEWLQKHLELMDTSGQRAADMVQQLLTLSRKRDTQFEALNLNAIVDDVMKLSRNTFDRCVTIRTDLPAQNSIIHGDHTQIEQVLLNICINANHAMTMMRPDGYPPGGILHVSLESIRTDEHFCAVHPESHEREYWKISIRDNGIGMDSKTLAKIFVPFFTTKEKGKGTGLGLSMVYQIVQQHGGFIDVYSEPEIGTTFNVYFPILYTKDLPADHKKTREISRGEGLILVVEDEEVLRHTEQLMLEKCGYEVITATNGEEGVEVFRSRQTDIRAVLMDLVMPKMSGEQAFQEIKKIRPDVKVILTSGFRQDERVNMALGFGIRAFIQKPFSLEGVARVLADVLIEDTPAKENDPV